MNSKEYLEKLGIDLDILFKALYNGIYVKQLGIGNTNYMKTIITKVKAPCLKLDHKTHTELCEGRKDNETEKAIETINQDLDRLEELEKENLELLVNKNVAQGIAKKFKEENDKLKKAIKIMKENLHLSLDEQVIREDEDYTLYYFFGGNLNKKYPTMMVCITKEQYELLKEVLGNE